MKVQPANAEIASVDRVGLEQNCEEAILTLAAGGF